MPDNLLDVPEKKDSTSLAGDFIKGFFHQAVESPVNALTQIVNKATGMDLPKLEIAGEQKEKSIGNLAGSIAGGALDFYLLSKAMGPQLANVGGAGITGTALRSGIVGGIYAGLLTPSADGSNSFIQDRLTNGLIGATTFAAMGAATAGLDRTGLFAVSELRSLGGSMSIGALSGLAGGVAHAEVDALLNKGKLLPTMNDLLTDAVSYSAFGATMGGINWGWNKATVNLKVNETTSMVKTEHGVIEGRIKYTTNSNGEVIQMKADLPNGGYAKGARVGWSSTKMSNGSWSSKGYEITDGSWRRVSSFTLEIPKVSDISLNADKVLVVDRSSGERLTFDKNLQKSHPAAEARQAAAHKEWLAKNPPIDYSDRTLPDGTRHVRFEPPKPADGKQAAGLVNFEVNKAGVDKVSIVSPDGRSYSMERSSGAKEWTLTSWSANKTDVSTQSAWKGDVAIKLDGNGKVSHLEFKSDNGKVTSVAKQSSNLHDLVKNLSADSNYLRIHPNSNYLRMSENGELWLRDGKTAGAQEIPIRPGVPRSLEFDIGDRGPQIVKVPLKLTPSSDGKGFTIKDFQLKPGTILNLNFLIPSR